MGISPRFNAMALPFPFLESGRVGQCPFTPSLSFEYIMRLFSPLETVLFFYISQRAFPPPPFFTKETFSLFPPPFRSTSDILFFP